MNGPGILVRFTVFYGALTLLILLLGWFVVDAERRADGFLGVPGFYQRLAAAEEETTAKRREVQAIRAKQEEASQSGAPVPDSDRLALVQTELAIEGRVDTLVGTR